MADKRVEKTKALIKETFLELSGKIQPERITVKAICDKANINRGTFYHHYLDIPDLIEKLEFEAADKIAAAILTRYHFNGETATILNDLFKCLNDFPEDASLLFGVNSNWGDNGLRHLYDTIKSATFPHWKAKSHVEEAQLNVIFDHTMNSIFNLLKLWQSGNVKMSESEFKELYNDIIIHGIYTYIYQ